MTSWLAWGRRRRANKALFVATAGLAAFVTVMFTYASFDPNHGDFLTYFALYWVWGVCAVAALLGMAEYKTSPLRNDHATVQRTSSAYHNLMSGSQSLVHSSLIAGGDFFLIIQKSAVKICK